MAKIKLTKSAVDAAQPQAQAVELRDTLVPGFLCKITPAGRKVFMLQYRTNAGERRKPALGQYGELTVEQARSLAQEWLAQVRRGGDPAADKAAARQAPTVKELCTKFMEDYSKLRNKPSTQHGYQSTIDRNIVPMLGRMKVQDVKRPDVAGMMKKMAHKPADANRTFSVMRRMFNLAEVWGYRSDGTNPCRHVPMFPNGKATHLISDEDMGKLFRHLDHLEAEGLENYVIPLAIRLQFEFAGRRGEIVTLQWDWVAVTVDVVTPRTTRQQPGEELAQAVGLDMAAWWKPTNEGYFRHVPKAAILGAVEQFAPSHVTRLAKMKKADIASEAERLANGTDWMPAIFKAEGTQAASQEQNDASEDAEAMTDEPAVALAAGPTPTASAPASTGALRLKENAP